VKIVVTEYISLDGVMEDPGGAEGTPHGGWSFQFWNEEAGKYKFEELFTTDALLLGRVTYEGFAKAWPSVKDEQGFADRMNNLPKYVVSTTLRTLEWKNSRLLTGDIAEEVATLKQQPGQNLLVAGSCKLVQTLMQYDLVDEYRLLVHPIVLGSGKRLFGEQPDMQALKLLEAKTFKSGIVALSYQPENRA
jgi:dihydrofolate reductase